MHSMNGNELKEILEKTLKNNIDETNNIDEILCNDLLDELEALGTQSLNKNHFKEVTERIVEIYKIKYSWSEFNDKNFADWKRIRSAIEHENTLVNHRLTWLLSSQTLLITAYILSFIQWSKIKEINEQSQNVYPAILLILALFGVVLSIFIWRTLLRASSQLHRLERWWYGDRSCSKLLERKPTIRGVPFGKEEDLTMYNPPIQGRNRGGIDRFINGESIPALFIAAWSFIIFYSGLTQLRAMQDTLSKNWLIYTLTVGAIVIIMMVIVIFFLIRRVQSLTRKSSSS
jgi:hypothetical protein